MGTWALEAPTQPAKLDARMDAFIAIPVSFVQDGLPSPRTLTVTPALAGALAYAYELGAKASRPAVTFTTLITSSARMGTAGGHASDDRPVNYCRSLRA
jgi:hypothetical protein